MKVQLWNSFSCNNSSEYRLVARFQDAATAARMGGELRQFFAEYGEEFDRVMEEHDYDIPDQALPTAAALAARLGFSWDPKAILSWGDEGLTDDQPSIEVIGPNLAIYHDYCGGFTDNVAAALRAGGAAVEPEQREPPDLSVRFSLPPGEAGEQLAGALATFLGQAAVHEYTHDFKIAPPWGKQRLSGPSAAVRWFREGERFGFKMPFPLRGLTALKDYLAAQQVRELDMRLCDPDEIAWFDMRDTLLWLDARIAAGEVITELDLSSRRLTRVPPQVFGLVGLRRLVLDQNPLGSLPAELGRLLALEELSAADCGLHDLPEALTQLPVLRRLDLSRNAFAALPAVLARLPALRALRAAYLRGVDLTVLAQLTALEELDLAYLRPAGKGLIEFPRQILALRNLRTLDLNTSALGDVPAELAELTALEELNLDTALGHVTQLPSLRRLPRLRSLQLAGGAGNTGSYPPHRVLDEVWELSALESLGIDRYGAEKEARGPLTQLPEHAFARLTELRTLDLSFNELTSLPESFYRLSKLESVDLRYTKLERATLERLAATFPRVKLDLRNVTTRHEVDDPHWQEVHTKVKQAAGKLRSDPEQAIAELEAALALCVPGSRYSDYDELYATYGLVDALGRARLKLAGAAYDAAGEPLLRYARRALELVPPMHLVWHFTDEGAFQMEVTRRAGNAVAWVLMERGEYEPALVAIERALSPNQGDRGYIFDTKVRILLRAGRAAEAFTIVESILGEDPAFSDFQDLKVAPEYLAWQRGGRERTRRG